MMNISQALAQLTPTPWSLLETQHPRRGGRVVGVQRAGMTAAPVVCELPEPGWQGNGRLLAAAPELLVGLALALRALEEPGLVRAALVRGRRAIERATGRAGIQPDWAVLTTLRAAGIAEPTLSELALTATAEQVEGWLHYARKHNLGAGFVVIQLRAGEVAPSAPGEKSWYTEAERQWIVR